MQNTTGITKSISAGGTHTMRVNSGCLGRDVGSYCHRLAAKLIGQAKTLMSNIIAHADQQ
jgi:hypothetical protein